MGLGRRGRRSFCWRPGEIRRRWVHLGLDVGQAGAVELAGGAARWCAAGWIGGQRLGGQRIKETLQIVLLREHPGELPRDNALSSTFRHFFRRGGASEQVLAWKPGVAAVAIKETRPEWLVQLRTRRQAPAVVGTRLIHLPAGFFSKGPVDLPHQILVLRAKTSQWKRLELVLWREEGDAALLYDFWELRAQRRIIVRSTPRDGAVDRPPRISIEAEILANAKNAATGRDCSEFWDPERGRDMRMNICRVLAHPVNPGDNQILLPWCMTLAAETPVREWQTMGVREGVEGAPGCGRALDLGLLQSREHALNKSHRPRIFLHLKFDERPSSDQTVERQSQQRYSYISCKLPTLGVAEGWKRRRRRMPMMRRRDGEIRRTSSKDPSWTTPKGTTGTNRTVCKVIKNGQSELARNDFKGTRTVAGKKKK